LKNALKRGYLQIREEESPLKITAKKNKSIDKALNLAFETNSAVR
jgi:hypothetical protein